MANLIYVKQLLARRNKIEISVPKKEKNEVALSLSAFKQSQTFPNHHHHIQIPDQINVLNHKESEMAK